MICSRTTGKSRSHLHARRKRRFSPVALVLALTLLAGAVPASSLFPARAEGANALRISEVMTSNGSSLTLDDGSLPDWIELENTSGEPVALTGYALLTEDSPSKAFCFPGGTLSPNDRIIIYCDDSTKTQRYDRYHAPFRLSAAGERIALLDPHGVCVDLVATPALARDQVYCRDASGEWAVSDFPTPGMANRAGLISEGLNTDSISVVPGEVEITEVMSRNVTCFADENGEHPDYIELHNLTDHPVSLKGWALSDSRSRLRKWQFPAVTLPPNGCLAVHCSGEDRSDDPEHLHTSFKLDRDGEELFLTDPGGVITSHIQAQPLEEDQALSLTEEGWTTRLAPSPGRLNDQPGIDAASEEIARLNSSGIRISELLASSDRSSDWIEICNSSERAVDLSGFGLSDNSARPRKWQFPAGTTIQPGAYIGVYADGKDGASDGNLHAGFKLSADGGYTVTLSDPQGHIIDCLFVPAQYHNISYGRPDGTTVCRYFDVPTPGAANIGTTYTGRAPMPVYSTPGGLYRTGDALTVQISVPADCRVYYTLDSSDPTQESQLYTGPIPVTGTTILRTRVYRDGCMPSYMDSQSYLYDVNNGNGTVYVCSLVSDPYNLTSEEYGIMAKGPNATAEYPYGSMGQGANFWMDWEREAHIEVFAPDGATLISQECGTKLHGESGRARNQKSLKVIARNRYGSDRFRAALFSRRPYTEYQSFVLRGCSQDFKARMRDAMLQQIAAGTGLMYQEYEIGILYINGDYWGHYNLRENINTTSICQFARWEGDEDDIDFVHFNHDVKQGSNQTMEDLLTWTKEHSDALDTDEAYDVLDSAIDIPNFLQYTATEIFVGNTDLSNVKRYRNPNTDGRWRWILYDLDVAFEQDTNSINRWLKLGGTGYRDNTDNILFIACMKNSRIRAEFLTLFGQMLATTCSTEGTLDRIEQFYNAMQPIMPDQLERWNVSVSSYESAIKKLVSYARQRPMKLLQYMKTCENLHLTREEMELYFGEAMARMNVTWDGIEAP